MKEEEREEKMEKVETIKLFDYVIIDNKINQFTYEVEEQNKGFYLIKKAKNEHRFVSCNDLDKIAHNRVISKEDNIQKFQKLIIDYQREKVKKYKERYEQQKKVLEELEKNTPSP